MKVAFVVPTENITKPREVITFREHFQGSLKINPLDLELATLGLHARTHK